MNLGISFSITLCNTHNQPSRDIRRRTVHNGTNVHFCWQKTLLGQLERYWQQSFYV